MLFMSDNRQNLEELQNDFNSLPRRIKEWLSSEPVSYLIHDINNRFDFKNEKVVIIPNLILYLVVKNLDPLNFLYELSQKLSINFDQAKKIAGEIEESILKPVKMDLRDIGINIQMIQYGKPELQNIEKPAPSTLTSASTETVPLRPTVQASAMPHVPMQKSFKDFVIRKPGEVIPETKKEEIKIEPKPVIDLGSFEIKGAAPKIPTEQKLTSKPEPAAPSAPFILHQHDQQEIQQVPFKKFSIKPELNVRVENYFQTPEPKKPAITAKIELPQSRNLERSDLPNIKQPQSKEVGPLTVAAQPLNNGKTRIVHYDGYRTPLSNIGTAKKEPETNINLSDKNNTALPVINQTLTKEIPSENKIDLRKFTKSDENTVDLRKKS